MTVLESESAIANGCSRTRHIEHVANRLTDASDWQNHRVQLEKHRDMLRDLQYIQGAGR